jgi:hypothetical protein
MRTSTSAALSIASKAVSVLLSSAAQAIAAATAC